MTDTLRYICYNSLKEKHDRCPNRKYNWVIQLQAILQTADKLWLWEAQDPEVLKEEIESILEFYKHKFIIEDEERCAGSSYSSLYYNISEGHNLKPYLSTNCPIHIQRIFSQLRMTGQCRVYINIKGFIYSWNAEELCTICNMNVPETLQHVLYECPMYRDARHTFMKSYVQNTCSMEQMLRTADNNKLYNIHQFVSEAMRIRAFITFQ